MKGWATRLSRIDASPGSRTPRDPGHSAQPYPNRAIIARETTITVDCQREQGHYPSMPTLTINYVYFGAASTHPRQPRPSNAFGGFAPIDDLSGNPGSLQNGTPFHVLPGQMPSPVSAKNAAGKVITYKFSFVNISGGNPSGLTWLDHTRATPAVTVGTSPIVVMIVYLPEGGNGNGTGAYIDAFDETTNGLFSDNFVTVSPDPPPPPPGPLTKSGNVDGWVGTTNTETIAAFPHIKRGNVDFADFDRWVDMGNPQSPPHGEIAGPNFTATKNTSYYALAFYKSPPPAPPPTTCQLLLENWNALEPKTDRVLLDYYREKLSACQGPQYTAAVNEITAILQSLGQGFGHGDQPPTKR